MLRVEEKQKNTDELNRGTKPVAVPLEKLICQGAASCRIENNLSRRGDVARGTQCRRGRVAQLDRVQRITERRIARNGKDATLDINEAAAAAEGIAPTRKREIVPKHKRACAELQESD